MIHPLLPNQLQKTQETMRMAAEFILRPISRKYDKAEHEPPLEMEQLNQAAAAQKKETGMGNDSVKSMDLGGRNLWAVISLEQMCWGDVGLFLARPGTGLGNAAIMAVGNTDQKALWGKRWAAMAITEPAAGSDSKNISTTAVLDGDEWVINGSKHYISGAGDSRCKILITMVVTNPEAPKHLRQSQILVPKDTPGLTVVRPMKVFGHDHAPHGHMHITFEDVRVPKSNIILGEGRGFEISQGRLGPGRIHHCMRSIGVAERALELMCKRALTRTAFGKPLAELGGNYDVIADSRIEIDQCRLAVLKAAHMMDEIGNKEARKYISAIKVSVPNMALRVIDRAIQMYGALGVSQDTPLAGMWMGQRTLRLADGPDEVHRRVIAREELKQYT